MAKGLVVLQEGVKLEVRLAGIRQEADDRHANALAAARAKVDERITELVTYRALTAVDAVLAA